MTTFQWLLVILVGLPVLAMLYLAVAMAYLIARDIWRDEVNRK